MMIPSFSGIVTLYFFFLVSLVLHTLASPMLHFCHHDQRDALLEFKHEFPVNESNSYISLSSWNKSSDCCFWEGVTCDAKSGEVISLDLIAIPLNNSLKPNSGLFKLHHLRNLTLMDCDLYGEIPSSLGNLSHLTHLDLWDNSLEGKVPASIGHLTQLRYLSLRSNKFSGNIPSSIGHLTQLGYLSLSDNKFSGNIPVSFANLTKLSYLDIQNNQFTGENFPLILLNLTSLSYLDISYNQFESTLPRDMSGFHNLVHFDVNGNSFSGPFPTSLFMIPSLTKVDLSGNKFKGPIEFSNISSSSKLDFLYLSQNNFDGPIPKSISKLLNLGRLLLSGNNFIGPIPTSISNLANLQFLDLSNNKLEGEIPGWLVGVRELFLSRNSFSGFAKSFEVSDLTEILALDLSSNAFRGPLPYWICKLRPLEILDLSNNSFSGSIPQCLKNVVVDLVELILRNNNFSGIILPEIFVNATRLVVVDVSGNQLEGKLPKSLINCISLQILNVRSNRIKDKFPSWLSSLPSLYVLILRSNEFYGPLYHPHVSIGFQSVKIIDISHNDFTGTLPPFYFSNWRQMTTLSEEDGGMYMEDPLYLYSYYRLSMEMVNKGVDTQFELIRRDFRAIDFSGNNFVGEIPKSIGLLKELRLLNLSGNAFTSDIPQSLANLTNLEALDLSWNQLSGQIPRDLGNLSFLSSMNFSHNNLEGPIPRGTQFQGQNCSVFMDNPKLYGLEDICGETHVPNPTPQESVDLSEPAEHVISWIAAAIAYVPGVFCGLVIGQIFFQHKHEWFMAMFRRNKTRSAR